MRKSYFNVKPIKAIKINKTSKIRMSLIKYGCWRRVKQLTNYFADFYKVFYIRI